MAKTKTGAKRVLLVKDNEGEFKVEIPADAKLTFGPAVPYARKNGYEQKPEGYALRLYQGSKDNLIAVFNGVHWFRDIMLPVARLIVREAGKSLWKSDENGYETQTAVKRDAEWVPDAKRLNSHEAERAPVEDEDLF